MRELISRGEAPDFARAACAVKRTDKVRSACAGSASARPGGARQTQKFARILLRLLPPPLRRKAKPKESKFWFGPPPIDNSEMIYFAHD